MVGDGGVEEREGTAPALEVCPSWHARGLEEWSLVPFLEVAMSVIIGHASYAIPATKPQTSLQSLILELGSGFTLLVNPSVLSVCLMMEEGLQSDGAKMQSVRGAEAGVCAPDKSSQTRQTTTAA